MVRQFCGKSWRRRRTEGSRYRLRAVNHWWKVRTKVEPKENHPEHRRVQSSFSTFCRSRWPSDAYRRDTRWTISKQAPPIWRSVLVCEWEANDSHFGKRPNNQCTNAYHIISHAYHSGEYVTVCSRNQWFRGVTIVCSKKVCSRSAQSNTSCGQTLMAFTTCLLKKIFKWPGGASAANFFFKIDYSEYADCLVAPRTHKKSREFAESRPWVRGLTRLCSGSATGVRGLPSDSAEYRFFSSGSVNTRSRQKHA